jgi:hypothetical protein
MANPWAGEAELTINGEVRTLKLTLGALATLEAEMEADCLVALVERFETGRFTTRDVIALLFHGLKACGWSGTFDELLDADIKGGAVMATRVAAVLLGRAFAIEGLAQ